MSFYFVLLLCEIVSYLKVFKYFNLVILKSSFSGNKRKGLFFIFLSQLEKKKSVKWQYINKYNQKLANAWLVLISTPSGNTAIEPVSGAVG